MLNTPWGIPISNDSKSKWFSQHRKLEERGRVYMDNHDNDYVKDCSTVLVKLQIDKVKQVNDMLHILEINLLYISKIINVNIPCLTRTTT